MWSGNSTRKRSRFFSLPNTVSIFDNSCGIWRESFARGWNSGKLVLAMRPRASVVSGLAVANSVARAAGRTVDEQLGVYRGRNALGRSLIPARDVASMAVLLASDRFAHTTGDILTIDGGLPDAFPR